MSIAPTQSKPWLRTTFSHRWIIVVVASLAMTATLPGRTHGVGLIAKPLLEDLSLSETAFGLINFWSILLGAAFCWPIGRVIDRFGIRAALTAVAASLGVVVIVMGHVTNGWALFVSLLLTRGLGQGALSVISTAMIGKWFNRRVGMAMGVFAILLAIGFIVSVLAMGEAIKSNGWRIAWRQMGWLLLGCLTPISLLFAGSPDNSPDVSESAVRNGPSSIQDQADFTLHGALATPAFWTFSAASCLFGCAWSAITLYNELILESRGFSRDDFYRVWRSSPVSAQVLSVFTSARGPLVLAWSKEWSGSYDVMFLGVAPLSLTLAIAAIFVPMPVNRHSVAAAESSLA